MQKQKIKEQFHKLIDEIEDESILQMLYEDAVEYSTNKETEEKLSEEEMASIELGLKQIEEGKVSSHDEVLKRISEWLNTK